MVKSFIANIIQKIKNNKKKPIEEQGEVKFINSEELEQKIQQYLEASGITREELEAPIIEFLNIDKLEDAMKYLENCDLTHYNSLQLEMILCRLDELQVLYVEECKQDKKKYGIMAIMVDLLGIGISYGLGFYVGVPMHILPAFLGTIGLYAGVMGVGGINVGINSSYDNMMKRLDDFGEKAFLVINTKSQVDVPKVGLQVNEKQETLQEKINRIDSEINSLSSKNRELLYNRLLAVFSEYRESLNIGKDVEVELELCGKPYYEYVLEKELEKLEVEIRKEHEIESCSKDVTKAIDDYSLNIANFTDKVDAFNELMAIVRNSMKLGDEVTNYEFTLRFANCFWETVRVTSMSDRLRIIKSVDLEFLDKIIVLGENYINMYGDETLKRELVLAKQSEGTDRLLYLMLLMSSFDKLDFKQEEVSERKRISQDLLATAN